MTFALLSVLATIAYYLLLIFFLLMIGRFVLDFVRTVSREFRPRGFGLVVAEAVYTVTDPPLRAVRKVIPPLRVGDIALDFGFGIVMLGVLIAIYAVQLLR
ncbi:YggT family protein [Herbiconiux sp. SYSU D00978]|uniref:YggT family protein n=1 Tax=Herbiconiux sp. SYSU D00978 TaxID=2812562 RepID=UPI001A97915A|nr:YggT family protein [Herbiconiux sp. SYSU D00978]